MEQRAIIWDLGGVLTEVDWKRYISCIGYRFFLRSLIFDWKIPYECKRRAFEFLTRIALSEDHSTLPSGVCIPGGMSMPPLMIAYQAGLLTREQIVKVLEKEMRKAEKEGFFSSYSEKLLIERIVDELFNPASLVYAMYLIPQGLSFIRSLAAQTFPDGKRRYRLYILSNWDPVSFQLIFERFPHFFSYFDGIVVSGRIGMVKPSYAMFEYLVKTYALDKERSIFIDDQPENIKAAQAYGIETALLFKNFVQLRQDLSACDVQIY